MNNITSREEDEEFERMVRRLDWAEHIQGTQQMTTKELTKPPTKTYRSKVMSQKTVDVKETKAPKLKVPTVEDIESTSMDWMNWVEYAQSRIRYLENKLANANETIEEQKENIIRLNRRIMQG